MRPDLLSRASVLRAERKPFVVATVVRAQRPTSAKAGDAALVLADGTLDGFVGGTCAESTVLSFGLRSLASGESTLLRITPSVGDVPASVGDVPVEEGAVTVANPCHSGGALDIFLEPMLPPPLVHVLGDAPVARALVALGGALGYEVATTVDPALAIPADAVAVVVASHGHDEEPVLTAALRAGVPYVALVASRRRGAAVLSSLDVDTSAVHSPAGLDIGARTAPEVALSILAEIVASRPRAAPPPPVVPPSASLLPVLE
ncbi:XdhC family protein [Phytohabitans sp. LJ34]|uniref:XdhC family protein n=1 Tax=Phytohabitans sp. LJ34 TaxID=3452217 RepID=UPI003F8A7515